MISESQVTRLTSHPKDSTLHRTMSPITALGNIIFGAEERVPPTGPTTPLPAASGLPFRDRPGPTLLSFRSKLAGGCRVVCCSPHASTEQSFEPNLWSVKNTDAHIRQTRTSPSLSNQTCMKSSIRTALTNNQCCYGVAAWFRVICWLKTISRMTKITCDFLESMIFSKAIQIPHAHL